MTKKTLNNTKKIPKQAKKIMKTQPTKEVQVKAKEGIRRNRPVLK
jgi:hypothetical protein|tara:strand:+ start:353 stop:487 length:135 start_codon:yes stop_codon:yes gene_type:complete